MNIEDMLIKLIDKIDRVTDKFYLQKPAEGYVLLDEVLKDLGGVMDAMILAGSDVTNILNVLTIAMDALQKQDSILLADILQYEVKEQLQAAITIE